MSWIDRMNDAIVYIESHLSDEVDFDAVAQKACCSIYNFQRTFSFIFGIPLSEYIRGRRLTLAAAELADSEARIIDVAVKHGYGSQEAFSRAFTKFFGLSPAHMRTSDAILPSCPRAVISLREGAIQDMDDQSYLLRKTEPSSIFKRETGLPGWMRFSITAWTYLDFIGQSNDPWPTYSLIASLCGEAFSPVNYTVPASGIKHLFGMLGFEHDVFSTASGDADYMDRESLRKRIVRHISQNRLPVLLCNDKALSLSSRGLVVGYENNGDKLIYWGCFPYLNGGSDEPIHIPVENWYAPNTTFTLIGKRKEFPEPKALYAKGVQEALSYLDDGTNLRNTGFYDEWKRVLMLTPEEMLAELRAVKKTSRTWSLYESFYDEEDLSEEKCEKMLLEIIDPLWCDFALRRACAGMFVGQAKNHLPDAQEQIGQAQASMMNIHNLMNEYPRKIGCMPGEGIIDKNKFADPSVRRELIEIVEKCWQEEKNAVLHLRNACELLRTQGG